ncbi:MAG: hypothetical protein WKF96_02565 [Solirubrobacteraceae bacterium]
MFFPITTIVLAACLLWTRAKAGHRSALFVALSVWGVGVLLMSAPIFTFAVEYSLAADGFVAVCLFAITFCYILVRAQPRDVAPAYWNGSRELFLVRVLGVAGIIGCLVLLLSEGVSLSAANLIKNLAAIRAANFESLEDPGTGSVLQILATLLASGSILSVLAAARFGRAGGWSIVILGVANFLLITAVGLFVYAGRTTLFYAVGLVLISLFVTRARVITLKPVSVLLAGLLLVGIWYFSISWVQSREGSADPERALIGTQRANYRPWLAPIARGDDAVGVGLISLGYMASPLPTLAFYIGQGATPGPFWGGYSFPLQAGAVEMVTLQASPRRWIDTRHEVFAPLESAGYFGNVWATWLRDLLVDFGYAGSILFCGLFGAFMAWARNAFEQTGAFHYHCLEVLACFTLAYGAFAGILFFTFLSTSFFLAVALMLAVRLSIAGTRGVRTQSADRQAEGGWAH